MSTEPSARFDRLEEQRVAGGLSHDLGQVDVVADQLDGLVARPGRRARSSSRRGRPWPAAIRSATRALTSGAVSRAVSTKVTAPPPGRRWRWASSCSVESAAQWTSSTTTVTGAARGAARRASRPAPRTCGSAASRRRPPSRPTVAGALRRRPTRGSERRAAVASSSAALGVSRVGTARGQLADHLDEGLVGNPQVLAVAPEQHPVTPSVGVGGDLGGQAGLADAGLPEDPHPAERSVAGRPPGSPPCLAHLARPGRRRAAGRRPAARRAAPRSARAGPGRRPRAAATSADSTAGTNR